MKHHEASCLPETLIELAILGVLAERTEIYPSHLIGELRRRAPSVPPERVSRVLVRLWEERRVARLWHRYLLPDQVGAVRARWLAMVECHRDELNTLDPGYAGCHAILTAWDGWRAAAAEI
ncbi:hypothetical protein [Sphingomonas sp.]|uniref:hypothetical protein n=1 Tax=Sphingomonas sp. TaxID=28214 RepID=UPI0035C7B5C8